MNRVLVATLAIATMATPLYANINSVDTDSVDHNWFTSGSHAAADGFSYKNTELSTDDHKQKITTPILSRCKTGGAIDVSGSQCRVTITKPPVERCLLVNPPKTSCAVSKYYGKEVSGCGWRLNGCGASGSAGGTYYEKVAKSLSCDTGYTVSGSTCAKYEYENKELYCPPTYSRDGDTCYKYI